ncbi:hypothetical protein [Nocardia crassostreae]|uniref:hypothetical protein n=1 Tax=Nocardia crassostreae TaxID=53428 RepID=UPI0012F8C2F9|nr:hypothetical protein [Nocardia crassostreae]
MNAGLDEDDFVELVTTSEFSHVFATENGRDRSYRLEGRLRKVWRRAEDRWNPPVGGGVAEVRKRLEALSKRLDGPWYRRTASSNRAVSLALVAKAHEVGAWTVDVSQRELSVRAGVARTTVGNALKRLADMGAIAKDETREREADHAQRWVINLDWPDVDDEPAIRDNTGPYEPLPPTDSSYGLTMSLNHPAFLRAALGQTAERVWLDLAAHPGSTAVDIASRLGMTAKTARRALDMKLIPNGLAVRSGGEPTGKGRPSAVYRVDASADFDRLDKIAEEYRVSDWYDKTGAEYERQRAGFSKLREQWGRPVMTDEPDPVQEVPEPADWVELSDEEKAEIEHEVAEDQLRHWHEQQLIRQLKTA